MFLKSGDLQNGGRPKIPTALPLAFHHHIFTTYWIN